MRHMTRVLGYVAMAVAASVAMPAAATQWDSTGASAAGTGSAGACATTGYSTLNCQMTVGTGTTQLKVRAYSTRTANAAGDGSIGTTTGNWRAANLMVYSGGFGIMNAVSGDINESVSPEHATDNDQVVDVLVYELPAGELWDIDAFRLGWAQDGQTYSGTADITAWFGGSNLASDFNFSTVCFSSCDAGGTTLASLGGGFSDITGFINNAAGTAGTDNNIAVDTIQNFSGVQTGRYLIMTGRLGDDDDHFKMNMLKATPKPPGQTPAPGTVVLLGLGLIAMGSLRRRLVRR